MIFAKINQPIKIVLVDIPDALDEVEKNLRWTDRKAWGHSFRRWSKKMIQIGVNLKPDLKEKLIKFLQANTDVFAWLTSNMPGISADVIIYKLNMDSNFRSV